MRMKMTNTLRTAARWIQRVIDVRLPMDALVWAPHPLRAEVSSDREFSTELNVTEPPGKSGESVLATA
ncbi:MAG TPA: hypothetical protein VKW78_04915 [Terriglobales bacterium]|nr:hypothetical protein [Terriglobales bacterium]